MKNTLLKIWSFIWRLLVVGIISFFVLGVGYNLLSMLASTGFIGMNYSWSFLGGTSAYFKGMDYVLYVLVLIFAFIISRLFHKKDLKETFIFWLKIIIIVMIVLVIYLASCFVEEKYINYNYNKLKNNADITFEFNTDNVYIYIDKMKANIIGGLHAPIEYTIKYSNLDEFIDKSQNHDGIVELYNENNKEVYGIKHDGDFVFLFIILNEYEYLMISI